MDGFFRILEKTLSELICTRLYLLNIQERLLGMDSEILKDLLVHSDFNNLTCHQHKEIFGNQSHYWGCRPEDPEFYDCHPEILWKDINVSLFVNIYLLVTARSSGILKAKQKLSRTFNSDKLGGIAFTKISKLTMCSA